MPRDPERNYLKAWRDHRRMTQVELAEAIGTTDAVISLLESGDRGLTPKWLRRITPVLGPPPADLSENDANDAQRP
ncbi:MAG: helix-turn-helix transcriptional regulator [Pseudomonadota bacterium]